MNGIQKFLRGDIMKTIKELEERIIFLENSLKIQTETISEKIEKEVAKTIFHQSKAFQHRIDQFLFDAKISLKNNNLKKLDFS